MFQCRFYEQEWPLAGEIVVVKIKEIHEHGISCSLLEYNEIEGYVPISELTRRRINSKTQSEMKKGQLDLARVVAVDAERGFIDLNKEQLPPEVVEEVTIRWNNSKKVHSIMKHVAQRIETPIQELYEKFLWPLARDMRKLGRNHAIMGLLFFLEDPEGMAQKYHLQQQFVDALLPSLRKRLKPQQHKIRALVKVNSQARQRDLLMKRALKSAALVSTPSCPVQIIQRQPSIWEVKIHTLKPLEGSKLIWQILEKIRRVLTFGNRGQFRLVKAPTMLDPYKRESVVMCQDPKIQIKERPLSDLKLMTSPKMYREDKISHTELLNPNKGAAKVPPSNADILKVITENRSLSQSMQTSPCPVGEAEGDAALDPSQCPKLKLPASQQKLRRNLPKTASITVHTDRNDESCRSKDSTTSSNLRFWDRCSSWNQCISAGDSDKLDNQLSGASRNLQSHSPVTMNSPQTTHSLNRLKTPRMDIEESKTERKLIPPRLHLPLSSSDHSFSFSSLNDQLASPTFQTPPYLKCHSTPIRHSENCPPFTISSDSLSPRISPEGLTPLQRKYLRELLSDGQLDDPDFNKSQYTFSLAEGRQ